MKRSSTGLSPQESVAHSDARIQAMRDADFIADHGRLMKKESDPTFDAFRRSKLPEAPFQLLRYTALIVLLPLRLLVAFTGCFIAYVLVIMFGPPVNNRLIHAFVTAKLPRWRRVICEIATHIMARVLLFALGFWRVHGSDAPGFNAEAARGVTVVTNHMGIGDPCLLAYVYAPAFVAKMLIRKIPLIGRVGAAQHAFYIDRFDGGARKTTDAIIERQKLALDEEENIPPVCIFPEGTTTNGRYLLRFRTGAFVAGTPVAPMLIKYPHKYFSPCLDVITEKDYIKGMITQIYNEVHYYRLPVYFPTDAERADPKLYANNVRIYMQEHSDFYDGISLELSDANFVDKKEYVAVLRGDKLQKGFKLR